MNEQNNNKLLNFLKEWLHEAEKPEGEERVLWFRTDSGLCVNAKMQHLDPARLSWVKNKISELEKELAQ